MGEPRFKPLEERKAIKINLDAFRKGCLIAHNIARERHGLDPLELDDELNSLAQEWAEQLSKERSPLRHRPAESMVTSSGEPVGEIGTSLGATAFGPEPVILSYEEIANYDFDNPHYALTNAEGKVQGHFTQLCWKDTKKVGIGASNGPTMADPGYCIMNYYPAGNYFAEGVLDDQVPRPFDDDIRSTLTMEELGGPTEKEIEEFFKKCDEEASPYEEENKTNTLPGEQPVIEQRINEDEPKPADDVIEQRLLTDEETAAKEQVNEEHQRIMPNDEALMMVFHQHDADCSGYIEENELQIVFQELGQYLTRDEVRKYMEKYGDKMVGGRLGFDDFKNLASDLWLTENQQRDNLREAFKMFDKDGNGFLTEEELLNILCNMGKEPLPADDVAMFLKTWREMDIDQDGKISYNEFVRYLVCGRPKTALASVFNEA